MEQKLLNEINIVPMKPEDYDDIRALWMTIRGFGIRALDDSREDIERFILRNPTTSVVLKAMGINKVALIAFTANDAGNAFWKQIGWTKRSDVNYYDFVLNEENITQFITGED